MRALPASDTIASCRSIASWSSGCMAGRIAGLNDGWHLRRFLGLLRHESEETPRVVVQNLVKRGLFHSSVAELRNEHGQHRRIPGSPVALQILRAPEIRGKDNVVFIAGLEHRQQ